MSEAAWHGMIEGRDKEIARLRGLLTAIANNEQLCLSDMIYVVREREGEGWEGPAVKSWGDAVTAIDGEFRKKE